MKKKSPLGQSLTKVQRSYARSLPPSNESPLPSLVDPFIYTEAIIEAIHEPILILDKELVIRSANKAFFKTFKRTKKQTYGRTIPGLEDQNPSVKEFTKRLKELSTQNTSFDEFEFTYTFNKIGKRTVLVNAKRMLLGKNFTDFILLGIEDVTKRKIIEQQKDDFVGFVTHELKTPITSASAFVQILQGYHKKTGDKKSQFLLAKISTQMGRLTSRLNAFSDVYKAQNGQLELNKKKFDLTQLVHEVVEAFQYTTTTHDLIIQGTITKPVFADREKIHEVLSNLFTNAIKYSPNADKVVIKLEEVDSEAIVRIQDFGIGISNEEQLKIFERFFRVKGKRENQIEGLGLGLYLVSTIITQHKGRLWLESKEKEGSTFSFSLPTK